MIKTSTATNPQKKTPSHFQFANYYSRKNIKKFTWIGKPIPKIYPSHLSTAFMNSDGSLSQSYISLDLDLEKTASTWISDGRINHEKFREALLRHMPFLEKYLSAICRSTGGKGIHVVLAFPPYRIGDERFEKTHSLFLYVYRLLAKGIGALGLGVDSAAIGENRLTMNWFNPEFVLYRNPEAEKMAWRRSEKHRVSVLRELMEALEKHPLVVGRSKKVRCGTDEVDKVVLYPNKRVEPKIAKLWDYVFEEHCGAWEATAGEIGELCGISAQVVRNIQNMDLACGLAVEQVCHGVWRVTTPDYVLPEVSRRIHELLRESERVRDLPKCRIFSLDGLLKPCDVDPEIDGERNKWLVSISVWLKVCRVSQGVAVTVVERLVRDIPGWESSAKCKAAVNVVESIYRNRPVDDFRAFQALPVWLRKEISWGGGKTLTGNKKKPFLHKKTPEGGHLKFVKNLGENQKGSGESPRERKRQLGDASRTRDGGEICADKGLLEFVKGFAPGIAAQMERGVVSKDSVSGSGERSFEVPAVKESEKVFRPKVPKRTLDNWDRASAAFGRLLSMTERERVGLLESWYSGRIRVLPVKGHLTYRLLSSFSRMSREEQGWFLECAKVVVDF